MGKIMHGGVNYSGGSATGSLDDLSDVIISSPSDSQVVAYDSTIGKFKNMTVESVGGHSVPTSGDAGSDELVLGNDSRLVNVVLPVNPSTEPTATGSMWIETT